MPKTKTAEEARRDTGRPADAAVASSTAATALQLFKAAQARGGGLLYIARSERRAALVAEALTGLAPQMPAKLFPAWDCMPYDRASPSAEVMATRIEALRWLAGRPAGPWILLTAPEALLQQLPPRSVWTEASFPLSVGEALDMEALQHFLIRAGYFLDERVDEPGEAAIRGAVVDIYATGLGPVRIEHAKGRIIGIRRYDPLTQRTSEEIAALELLPASEVVLPESPGGEEAEPRSAGMEHHLPEVFSELETVFDYLPDAAVALDPGVEERRDQFLEQIADGYETRQAVRADAAAQARPPLPPSRLYLDRAEWTKNLNRRDRINLTGIEPVPRFAREARPQAALASFVAERLEAGDRVVLAGLARDLRSLVRRAGRNGGSRPEQAQRWDDAVSAPPGTLLTLEADLEAGLIDGETRTTLIAAADFLGSRAGRAAERTGTEAELGLAVPDLRVGDAVIHLDHGMAALRGIETISPPGGPVSDAVVLEFAAEAKLLVPAGEIAKIWRYGADPDAVSLDRLGGAAWPKRRAELDANLAALAKELTDLAKARLEASAPKLAPPRADYERFAAGFPFTETADQASAIEDALQDLASGRSMDRLVCGDVGFGKTEVALRAAAAAVLSGKQVAVVAPTTVLVRQHVRTFRRRFAGFGVEVAHLSRLVKAAEARAVKQGLASGETPLVVGTHALAGKGVTFKDLGLLIIDEEHRFGAAQKEKLRKLGEGVHVLTLTATPIPRTLQSAVIGLRDLSIIATPPTRRQPIRTFLTPFDPATIRAALMRERRRGGQSFVVCPRVEDIEPMASRLRDLLPELHVVIAHGKMPADEMDAVMVDFADGVGDVLLATNIIETGLDVPRANTILIWRADRFGLGQLHQLRGRVGRGRLRGTAYLMTDPAAKIAPATEQRLRTLEAMDRLGAGFAISARDLDLRGAGDLVGEEQAGHAKLIGMALYRHMLERALMAVRGDAVEEWEPEIHLGVDAYVPDDYVPEPDVRIGLYARLAHRLSEGPDELLEELEDRFGPAPEPVRNLVAIARLQELCRLLEIARLDAGPAALALTVRPGVDHAPIRERAEEAGEPLEWTGERLILKRSSETGEERRNLSLSVLEKLAAAVS